MSTMVRYKGYKKDIERIPLRITDTTLRDAHQSLWATRMRTDDILGIIDTIDSVGYYSLEVWGGATFDVCLRFLREDPWERLRAIKARAKKTPLQMLLRGQNVLGYKNYPDDLVERFIALACQNGVDIFRIFDALNDTRNLENAIKAVKKYGGHAQGTIAYTISPVHTIDKFVKIAKTQVEMGVDSIAIKDMAGILSPISAEALISALVKAIKVPIQVHSHTTSGMAISTYVEAVRAGAGAIDCAISPMAGSSSQPPVETMLAIFDEMPFHANLDMEALQKVCNYFEALAPKRQTGIQIYNTIDPEILIHHIPGGMISNLRGQLQQQGALDKLGEVLAELPKVREDLGFPPLVTPTSQILGVQAVMNVIAGERYKLVTQETKDYCKGLYGRSPAPMNPAIRKKILGKEKPVTCRPADLLEPILPTATNDIDPTLIKSEEDIISYCLFPQQALDFFKWRAMPEDKRPRTPADIELDKMKVEKSKEIAVAPVQPLMAPHDYKELQGLLDKINLLNYTEVTIKKNDIALSFKSTGMTMETAKESPLETKNDKPKADKQTKTGKEAKESKSSAQPVAKQEAPVAAAPAEAPQGPSINSPLKGTFYLSSKPGLPALVKVGDDVKAGQTVCIVEAMKLFNEIKASCNCKILQILVEPGAVVEKNQPMISYKAL